MLILKLPSSIISFFSSLFSLLRGILRLLKIIKFIEIHTRVLIDAASKNNFRIFSKNFLKDCLFQQNETVMSLCLCGTKTDCNSDMLKYLLVLVSEVVF